jgi:Xaa-Pro aminopeptidase
VWSLSELQRRLKEKTGLERPATADVLDWIFKERGITHIRIPSNFPVVLADRLRSKGYTCQVQPDPLFPERTLKRPDEIEAIRETARRTEQALRSIVELLAQAEIRGEELWLNGQPLTSERVRKTLHLTLMGLDCLARETIVAGGTQACNPHAIGCGVLKAHWPIVLDVFPVSLTTRYYADITRTVVRGEPSVKVRRMYKAVLEAQEIAMGMLKAGVDGQTVHQAVLDYFAEAGFPTGQIHGRMQGFFHGTGHGLGLEIHEPPRIGPTPEILQAGQVVTVEPGLYYLDSGGIRIEDDVVITENGCESLTQFPKVLELG